MNNLSKRILSSIILLPIILLIIIFGSYGLIFLTITCFILAFYEWCKISKTKKYKIFGFIFLFFSFYSFYQISSELLKILFVISICVSTDIGGYVFGKLFKGPKLTKISPNKTYAGLIGGYFLTIISFYIFMNYLGFSILDNYLFLICMLLSTVNQLGDLFISYFKRLSKVKDTGKLIPGHGGLLDRIDGMIFAFPTYYIIDFYKYSNL